MRSKIKYPGRNRIYILPTQFGLYFFAVVFLLFVISLTYGNSLAFSTTFLFVSILMVSAIYTHFNLEGLALADKREEILFIPGRDQDISLGLRGEIREHFDVVMILGRKWKSNAVTMEPGTPARAMISLPEISRGAYTIGKVRMETQFPFGIFRSWKYLNSDMKLHVSPRPFDHLGGGRPGVPVSEGEDPRQGLVVIQREGHLFDHHSRYSPGDSVRRVDWKVSARRGKLFLKNYYDEGPRTVAIDLETIALPAEKRLEQAAWFAWEGAKNSRTMLFRSDSSREFEELERDEILKRLSVVGKKEMVL